MAHSIAILPTQNLLEWKRFLCNWMVPIFKHSYQERWSGMLRPSLTHVVARPHANLIEPVPREKHQSGLKHSKGSQGCHFYRLLCLSSDLWLICYKWFLALEKWSLPETKLLDNKNLSVWFTTLHGFLNLCQAHTRCLGRNSEMLNFEEMLLVTWVLVNQNHLSEM